MCACMKVHVLKSRQINMYWQWYPSLLVLNQNLLDETIRLKYMGLTLIYLVEQFLASCLELLLNKQIFCLVRFQSWSQALSDL